MMNHFIELSNMDTIAVRRTIVFLVGYLFMGLSGLDNLDKNFQKEFSNTEKEPRVHLKQDFKA